MYTNNEYVSYHLVHQIFSVRDNEFAETVSHSGFHLSSSNLLIIPFLRKIDKHCFALINCVLNPYLQALGR